MFENFRKDVGKWFSSSTYSPAKELFATIFYNNTDRKKVEEKLIKERTSDSQETNRELENRQKQRSKN
jgi:hypothetical protein